MPKGAHFQPFKMINILYIHQSSELYGSDKTLLHLVTKLDRTRYNPIVVLPENGLLKDALLIQNVKVIQSPVIKLHRNMFTVKYLSSLPVQVQKSISDIRKELHGLRIDIVQSNTLAVLLGVFLARKLKAKHVWHVHEIIVHPKFISNLYPTILNRYSDTVVCNSRATYENLLNRNKKLEGKLRVVHNGLDAADFVQNPTEDYRKKFGYQSTDIIITLVGRISRLKGHLLLLKVFENHFVKNHNVQLLFTGSPVKGQEHYLENIENEIRESNLEERVRIFAFQKNLLPIWIITDIAVSPSTEAESFGLVALEAMLSKKPVVATDLGGLKEIVVDGNTGFLFENENETALFKALEKLVNSEQLRADLGKKGYERAVSEFTLDEYLRKFDEIYTDLLS